MTEINENIKTYIREYYINSDLDHQFAILVKGEWGCGKTFLVKQILEDSYGNDWNKRVIWLSVYGLSTISQLRQKLFEKLHPILTSRVAKFAFSAVKAGLKASTTLDFNNDNKDDLSLDLAIPDFDKDENGKQVKIKKLLVVDDIERCSIPISEILGFFSEEILENKVKAIFISNDEKIKKLQNDESKATDSLNDYKSIKEKIIGMEFEVKPDISSALEHFIKDLKLYEYGESIRKKTELVIFKLGYKNLRGVRQALIHIRRILDILENEEKTPRISEYISLVIEYYLVLFTQYSSGVLSAEQKKQENLSMNDIFSDAISAWYRHNISLKQKNKNKDLFTFQWEKIPLQDLYFKLIYNGDYNTEEISKDFTEWTKPMDNRTPFQKLIFNWTSFNDNEFNEYYKSVKKDFEENNILSPNQIYQWVDFELAMIEYKISAEESSKVEKYYIGYIEKNKLQIEDLELFLNSYSERSKEHKQVLNTIRNKISDKTQEVQRQKIKEEFEILFRSAENNISKLSDFIYSYSSRTNNIECLLLTLIDVTEFYRCIENLNYENQSTIFRSFEERYKVQRSNNKLKQAMIAEAERIKEISELFQNDVGDLQMSPTNILRTWISGWYLNLYKELLQAITPKGADQ